MTTIRAHYDGKVIVPDEPVDIPTEQPLEVSVRPLTREDYLGLTIEERLRRLKAGAGHIKGVTIPLEALRRENLYDERE